MVKHCGNCKFGKGKPQNPCLDCNYYNGESFNNNWEGK